jgi:hypothetical protein
MPALQSCRFETTEEFGAFSLPVKHIEHSLNVPL